MLKPEKIIIYISMVLFILSAYAYLKEVESIERKDNKASRNFIGVVVESEGDTKIRFGDSISWKKLEQKSRIYTGVYLYTGLKSNLKIALLDHSLISLKENSLIFIDTLPNIKNVQRLKEQRLDPLQLKYYGGIANIETSDNSAIKKIKTKKADIELNEKKAEVKIAEEEKEKDEGKKEKTRSISVISGNVQLTRSAGNGIGGSRRIKHLGAGSSGTAESLLSSDVTEDIDKEMKKAAEEEQKKQENFQDFKDRHNFKVFINRLKKIIQLIFFGEDSQKDENDEKVEAIFEK